MTTRTIQDDLRAAFDEAGVEGSLHAIDLDSGNEVRYRADQLNHLASVGKIPILVTLMRSVAAGEHSLEERVTIPAGNRTLGPTGLSTMTHETELSLQDLAHLMIVVSDNHATDVILGMVSPERVTATMRELGLQQTTLEGNVAELLALARPDMRVDGTENKVKAMETSPHLRGETGRWRTTPEEMTRLLTLIWSDQAAPPELCAVMRIILQAQVWPHRLGSGFPDEVKIGAKTGTLAGARNECGVLEFPDGKRYAVAVFVRRADFAFRDPRSDRVIGTAARLAVDHLRA